MKERLRCHRDPNYRRKNPSLHYYVWDLGFTDKEYEIEEQFVFLSIFPKEVDSLLLNLLEMWCCLILQTTGGRLIDGARPPHELSGNEYLRYHHKLL